MPTASAGSKMLIRADEMTYHGESEEVIATGNVEIYYDGNFLSADRVVYNQKDDRVTAYGNVRFRDPTGAVTFSDEFRFSGDFKEGFVNQVSMLTAENARIVAVDATRVGGNIVIFNKAVYTACETPGNRSDETPLWQIKAVKVVHDQEERMVYMQNATFEFAGVPIMYFPYFAHPDPTVKRKSGFLTPKMSFSDELGATYSQPYFWAIAPNYDITFTPRVMSSQGLLGQAEWRHRLHTGTYTVNLTGIRQLDPDALVDPGNRDFRGSASTSGLFNINTNWSWGWNAAVTSDETYLKVYDLWEENWLKSDIFLTGLRDRSFFQAKAYHFESLRGRDTRAVLNEDTGAYLTDPSDTTAPFDLLRFPDADLPLVHPVIDYNVIYPGTILGGELSMNFNALSLTRDYGADSQRVIGEMRWRREFTDGIGQRFTPFFNFRGDIYYVNDVRDQTTGLPRDAETVVRGMATAGLEYRYPFISVHSWGTQVIEPVAQILVRPDQQARERLPNEDARSLVFDDTILFAPDKFSGFDRTEGGVRANVGLRYSVQTNSLGYGSLLFGQSYHLAGQNPFQPGTGLSDDISDFIGALYLQPIPNLRLASRVTFDADSFELKRHEFDAAASYGPASVNVAYADFRDVDDGAGGLEDRQELVVGTKLSVTDHWQLFGSAQYDVDEARFAQTNVGVGYVCDCGEFRLDYSDNFFADRDDEPDRRITLTYYLRTLGGGSFGTSVGQLSNSSD